MYNIFVNINTHTAGHFILYPAHAILTKDN